MQHFVPQSEHVRGQFVSYTLEGGVAVKSQRLTACSTPEPTELPFWLVYIVHNYSFFNNENQFYLLSVTYIINLPHLFRGANVKMCN
jgi:hypothetical protein